MSQASDRGRGMVNTRGAVSLLAILLLLLAGWFAWSAYAQWHSSAVTDRVQQARDRAVQQLSQVLASQTRQLDQVLAQPPVAAALANGNAAAAAAAIRQRFMEAEDVQIFNADLSEAYQNMLDFGYARLGLLESVLGNKHTQARVVRDAQRIRLGLAAAVRLGHLHAVAYVRLPLARLTGPLAAIDLTESGYMALRQGNYTIAQRGNLALSDSAEMLAKPLSGDRLRIAAAVPQAAESLLNLGLVSTVVIAALLFGAAVVVLLISGGRLAIPYRRQATGTGSSDELTFAQSLQYDHAEANAGTARTDPLLDAAPPPTSGEQVAPGLFLAYDIRGVAGKELTPIAANLIGQAIGSLMQSQGLHEVVVGRDGRLSGPELSAGLIEGLRHAGCNVTDIGQAPTPVVYFGAYHLRIGSCVVVTGSHNPPEYNGFKIVVGGHTLSGTEITALYQCISQKRLHTAVSPGTLVHNDISEDYIQRIADDVQLDRPLKVVADAGNGVAGDFVPRLLQAIGAEVVPLYCDVDGTFPNHHPDPSEPRNLADLIDMVQRFQADLGLAFDGDGDRLGVVTRQGKIIYADRLLMLFAADVLQRNPGALVIYDVKCTGKLSDHVLRNGGSPMMWKTGHALIKAKMRETDAELAGEMSGHFFFNERWYGFDDGLYAAARLLEILAQRQQTPSAVLDALPESVSTPEIKQPVEEDPHALVARFVARVQTSGNAPFEGARLSTIDGLRADFGSGWGLLRASNTTPVLVLRFEGDTPAELERIRALFRTQLQLLLPEQNLVF